MLLALRIQILLLLLSLLWLLYVSRHLYFRLARSIPENSRAAMTTGYNALVKYLDGQMICSYEIWEVSIIFTFRDDPSNMLIVQNNLTTIISFIFVGSSFDWVLFLLSLHYKIELHIEWYQQAPHPACKEGREPPKLWVCGTL